MSNIPYVPPITTVSGSDMIPAYVSNYSYVGRMTVSQLLEYFQKTFASPEYATQYETPSTGTTVGITDNGNNVWLLLAPAGTLAALTVALPNASNAADGQELIITSTQIITSLTVSSSGATAVNGAPSTLAAANGFFRLRFYTDTNSWYRVG